MATTKTTRVTRAVSHTANRSLQVANALRQNGYEAKAEEDSNWITVTRPDGLKCGMKVYDTPSKYGIERGCLSKMDIRSGNNWLYNFDRGLDVDELDNHPEARHFFNDLIAIAN